MRPDETQMGVAPPGCADIAWHRRRLAATVAELQRQAAERGLGRMTMAEIDAE